MTPTFDAPVFQLLLLLRRRWKTVVALCVLGLGVGTTYALLSPEWYTAHLRVVPSMKSPDAAMNLASKLPLALDSISTDVQRIDAVFRSDSVSDAVIERFELMKTYETTHIEHARAELWKHCATSVDRKSNFVTLNCEDREPLRAKEMTAYFGEVANKVFRRVSTTSSGEERRFLETQVVSARKAVDDASIKLREFQEKFHVVDLPEQSKAVISAMASIQAELVSKELELSYVRRFSARTEGTVMQLEQQIAIMKDKLTQLEAERRPDTNSGSGSASVATPEFFPGAMTMPELRFELEQLMREQKVRETVFLLMTQRYEMAKVDEARDTSTFQVLDAPTTPTIKSRPRRKYLVGAGGVAGFILACLLIVLPAWWRRRLQTTAPLDPA